MLPSVQLSDLSDIYPHTHPAKHAPQNTISDCGTNQHYHQQESPRPRHVRDRGQCATPAPLATLIRIPRCSATVTRHCLSTTTTSTTIFCHVLIAHALYPLFRRKARSAFYCSTVSILQCTTCKWRRNPQSISFLAHPSFRSPISRLHLLPLHLQLSGSKYSTFSTRMLPLYVTYCAA